MSKRTRIFNVGDKAVVWPGNIALPQYQERARRCSVCEHRKDGARSQCALMPQHPPFSHGLAVAMSRADITCPDGRWVNDNAPQGAIIDALAPMDAPQSLMQMMAHGAAGLTKAALGMERTDDATLAARYAVCASCDRNALGVCTECGCIVAAKMRLASEACPLNRWQSSAHNNSA